jgi:putative transcriptional regulator
MIVPIRVHLDDILAQRSMSLTDLAAQVGLTLANLSILKTGKARAIRFSTLEALCNALDCQPGDLMSYVPERSLLQPGRNAPGEAKP